MGIQLEGLAGELYKGGRWAATLHRGHLRVDEHDVMTAGGRVARRDAYWLRSGGGFRLHAQIGSRQWLWRDVSVEVVGDQVRMSAQGRPDIR